MTDRSLATHRMNLAKALSEPPAPPDDVLPGLPVGTVGALVAPCGTGKTMFAFGLAMELACGKPWLRQSLGLNAKQACVPQPVAMVVAEENEAEMHRRLWRILESMLPAGSKTLSVREEMRELEASVRLPHRRPLALAPGRGGLAWRPQGLEHHRPGQKNADSGPAAPVAWRGRKQLFGNDRHRSEAADHRDTAIVCGARVPPR